MHTDRHEEANSRLSQFCVCAQKLVPKFFRVPPGDRPQHLYTAVRKALIWEMFNVCVLTLRVLMSYIYIYIYIYICIYIWRTYS